MEMAQVVNITSQFKIQTRFSYLENCFSTTKGSVVIFAIICASDNFLLHLHIYSLSQIWYLLARSTFMS